MNFALPRLCVSSGDGWDRTLLTVTRIYGRWRGAIAPSALKRSSDSTSVYFEGKGEISNERKKILRSNIIVDILYTTRLSYDYILSARTAYVVSLSHLLEFWETSWQHIYFANGEIRFIFYFHTRRSQIAHTRAKKKTSNAILQFIADEILFEPSKRYVTINFYLLYYSIFITFTIPINITFDPILTVIWTKFHYNLVLKD